MSDTTSGGYPPEVIPAYIGWGNSERAKTGLHFYAIAAVERFGPREGDRYLIVRVGDRFTTDDVMVKVALAVEEALRGIA